MYSEKVEQSERLLDKESLNIHRLLSLHLSEPFIFHFDIVIPLSLLVVFVLLNKHINPYNIWNFYVNVSSTFIAEQISGYFHYGLLFEFNGRALFPLLCFHFYVILFIYQKNKNRKWFSLFSDENVFRFYFIDFRSLRFL